MRAVGERAIQAGGAVVIVAAALVAAVCESFMVGGITVQTRVFAVLIGGTAGPIGAVLAFAGNWALAALAVWWIGTRWAIVLPAVVWFAVMVAGSMPSTGGSIVIISTLNGYALLLAGTAGIAVSMFRNFRRKQELGRRKQELGRPKPELSPRAANPKNRTQTTLKGIQP